VKKRCSYSSAEFHPCTAGRGPAPRQASAFTGGSGSLSVLERSAISGAGYLATPEPRDIQLLPISLPGLETAISGYTQRNRFRLTPHRRSRWENLHRPDPSPIFLHCQYYRRRDLRIRRRRSWNGRPKRITRTRIVTRKFSRASHAAGWAGIRARYQDFRAVLHIHCAAMVLHFSYHGSGPGTTFPICSRYLPVRQHRLAVADVTFNTYRCTLPLSLF